MTTPSFSVATTPDGVVTASASFDTKTVSAINWAALLQAIVAALPSILAIIAAFTGAASPVPPASTAK